MTSMNQPGAAEHDGMTASVLGEAREYTSDAAARAAGAAPALAQRYWRALGYAAVDADAVEFTESDVRSLRLINQYIEQDIVTERAALQVSRLIGRTMSRLTESQIDVVVERLAEAGASRAEQIAFVDQLVRRVTPDIQFLLGQAWRRHMAATINRLNPDLNDADPSVKGVGFADLVGFTDTSRRLSENALLALLEGFEHHCAEIIDANGGRVVKMIGDEVLFTTTKPEALAEISLNLVAASVRGGRTPGLRVGIAYGPVVRHLGDVFGNTVNLASRLTGLAEPNTILASADLADALADNPSYHRDPRRHLKVRGIGTVTAYRLTRA